MGERVFRASKIRNRFQGNDRDNSSARLEGRRKGNEPECVGRPTILDPWTENLPSLTTGSSLLPFSILKSALVFEISAALVTLPIH